MTNRELHGYKNIPVSDTHIHIVFPKHPDATVDILRKFRDHFDYDSVTLQILTRCTGHRDCDPSNTMKGLYCKDILNSERKNSTYVYGSIFHFLDDRDTALGYLKQVKTMYEMGVDGYKFLDGKPAIRKMIGKPLSDTIFDKMYAFIEERGMPIKMHLADPAKYWGPKETMTPTAIARGWWCGEGTFPERDEFYEEVYAILRKFPKLKFCLAHLGYMSYDEAVAFLENFENTSFDLTPGASWCKNATEEAEKWKQFFAKYADRIYFGTDTYNKLEGEDNDRGYEASASRFNLVRKMLEGDSRDIIEYGNGLGDFVPLGLDDTILERIYYKNQRELLGEAREVRGDAYITRAKEMLDEYKRGEYSMLPSDEVADEIAHLEHMISHFSKK